MSKSTGAGGVAAARSANQRAGGGATPTPALQDLKVVPVPLGVAKEFIARGHYLGSAAGGTQVALGVFVGKSLMGVVTFGVGPMNAHRLVRGADRRDGLTLSRMCLSGGLPTNSASRVLGVICRAFRRHTSLRFLLSYADPSRGHVGTIYQGAGWTYTGLSEAMPLYDVGDGVLRHSRSLSHALGTHSMKYFAEKGVPIRVVPQESKHRYVLFLDPSWRERLLVPVSPYPRKENRDARS